ncbi:MAG: hypothetical protein ACXADB_07540 [Candidatus Hermodarchaeia archaeon]|jgi:hypothetical protein
MKKLTFIVVLIVPALLFSQTLGLGAVAGSPTGLALKYLMSHRSALAARAGWSFVGARGFHVTGDYQYLFPMVFETAEGTSVSDLTPYLAAGGTFRFKEEEETDDAEFHLGIRIGGGVEYSIARFGIFVEALPVVTLVPATEFDFEGGLGALFYF